MRLPQVLVLTSLVAVAAAAPHPGSTPAGDPTEEVVDWTDDFARLRRGLRPDEEDEIRVLLTDLRGFSRTDRGRRRQSALALLDLYGEGLAASRERDTLRAASGYLVATLAKKEYESLANPNIVEFVAREVLVVESENPPRRRSAAAHFLAEEQSREVLMALSVCARGRDEALSVASFEALSGWEDDGVHSLFQRTLWRADESTPPAILGAIEAHFRSVRVGPKSRVVEPLTSYVRERIASEDWRTASRAVAVSAALENDRAVPVLVDGLEIWIARADAGDPVRRMQNDVVRELQRRSGRGIGPHPERWRTWWKAVQAGHIEADPEDKPTLGMTESAFFGLRPVTDRVTFVIDRSGSMELGFPSPFDESAATWSRYRECIDQMLDYLGGLGTHAQFNVVLFANGSESWRSRLTPATAGNLRSAKAWLLRRSPKGATHLRSGVERAMNLAADGSFDLERLESDTIIVLCDGATSDGPEWVVPMLRRVNPEARLVIHGVQIGTHGDGTLELLARETGGEFTRVD